MEPTQQNQTGTPAGMPQEEKSVGALIGSIIVVAVIVIGGIYFWMTRSGETPSTETSPLGQTVPPDQETAALLNQGTSDEISDIEKDLNATNLNNLDAGMDDINAQL
ncbi:MAG: hypothetical protein US77_C0018G0007 [Microgenomates group bacterium GW2011_GWC1_38_14]|nr:MAG: hypothetical protein US77_C0018G0007 [Microgenomates group bacterium GW2011_GWC1_38_14]